MNRKKRVLVGGMHHESDTFNPITTGPDDIWVLRGKDLLEGKGQSSVFGSIATLKEAGYEVIPTLIARAVPNGEWDKDYYLSLKQEFLQAIKDALPLDVARIRPDAFVGEVVLSRPITPFLAAAQARGCTIQVATDMLFEQIPAYLEYFGLETTTPEVLRQVAQL